MGFLSKVLDIALRAKIIATRDLTNNSVNIIFTEYDSVPNITIDIVTEAMRLYNIELRKFDVNSTEYKHLAIDRDEMVKNILRSLGTTDYTQTLLNKIKTEK